MTIPYDSLHQKLITAVAGSQLPDLVRSDIIWVPELANLGVLQPLDTTLPDFKSISSKVFAGPLATNFWKGHYYGLPLDTNTRIWVYNPIAMQAAGVSAPPKTFAQLQSDRRHRQGQGRVLYAEPGRAAGTSARGSGRTAATSRTSTYTKATGFLNGPKAVAAVQMLVNLYKAGQMPNIVVDSNGGLGTYDGLRRRSTRRCSTARGRSRSSPSAYKNTTLAGTTVPAGPGGSVSVVGGEDIVMTKSSKNKAAAAEFMRFMLHSFAQTQMARAGQMPVLKSSTKSLIKIHPYYATYLKQIATAKPRTPTPKWPQIDQVFQTQVAKAFTGDETVQQALTERSAAD